MKNSHGILALAGRSAPPAKPAPQPLTPDTALDAGCTAEATAKAIAQRFCDRYGVEAARRLVHVMADHVVAVDRESRDLADIVRRAQE